MARKFSTDVPSKYEDNFLEAASYLEGRYPEFDLLGEIDFHSLLWEFEESRGSSFFCPPHYWASGHLPVPAIRLRINRNNWFTYTRKTIGICSRGINVGQELCVTISILHELTHFIQFCEDRQYSEVETTTNELDFMYRNHYYYFKKCQVIFDKRRRRNKRIKCRI